jgi:hypothetical protein
MSSLLLRMLLPLALLSATGIPSDPACASESAGSRNCGGTEASAVTKHVNAAPVVVAEKCERRVRLEAL